MWNRREVSEHSFTETCYTDFSLPIEVGDESSRMRIESTFRSMRVQCMLGRQSHAMETNNEAKSAEVNNCKPSLPRISASFGCPSASRGPRQLDRVFTGKSKIECQEPVDEDDISSLSSNDTIIFLFEHEEAHTVSVLPIPTFITCVPPMTAIAEKIERDGEAQSSGQIEIEPGVYRRLRGKEETTQAIESDFFSPCECCICSLTLFHIEDVDFVLCPDCRTLQNIDGRIITGSHERSSGDGGGVGLGIKFDELVAIQQHALRNRGVKLHVGSFSFDGIGDLPCVL
jgi:hypothetical protein